MESYINGDGIPLGFGMALAQNTRALQCFAALNETQKRSVIKGAHDITSKSEMRSYVNSIAGRDFSAT